MSEETAVEVKTPTVEDRIDALEDALHDVIHHFLSRDTSHGELAAILEKAGLDTHKWDGLSAKKK